MNTKTKEFVETLVDEVINDSFDVDEITTTLAVPGYQTPFAFAKDDFKKRNKKSLKSTGYTLVKEELDSTDIKLLKILIRDEVAEIFKSLYLKRSSWRK
tara:strand:- start:1587 stop:1883 length:297 start_codon:yes stop_codon:yes gene_type:complete